MASVNLSIVGGVAPFQIKVTRWDEGTDRFISYFGGLLEFTHETSNQNIQYVVEVKDQLNCIQYKTFVLNCGVIPLPEFTVSLIQPVCNGTGGYIPARLELSNITNIVRYKLCYDQTTFDSCGDCLISSGNINTSSLTIPLDTPNIPATRNIFLRGYSDATCNNWIQFGGSITTPVCGDPLNDPDFQYTLIQPYCSQANGGVPVNAVLKLTNLTNATRYKICYDSTTFNSICESSCSSSDGIITGSSIDIPIVPFAVAGTRNVTVRIFNGSGCSAKKDVSFSIVSSDCSANQITFLNLDYKINKDLGSNLCSTPILNDYDMYLTLNTPGVAENGQKALNRSLTEKDIPNNKQVPNVFIAASNDMNFGPGAFYRWQINLLELKAKYPSINVFTFDVYAKRTIGVATNPQYAQLTPQYNLFSGVSMNKRTPATGCTSNFKNATDAERNPYYSQTGGIVTPGMHTYNFANPDNRKIATFTFDTTQTTIIPGSPPTTALGKVTSWTNIP